MPRKLHILTTALRYPPAPGGAEKVAEEITLRLKKRGHETSVLTSNLKCHNTPNVSWLKPWEYRDDPPYITRCRASYFDQFPYPYMHGMFTRLLQAKKVDLIHSHSFYYYPADIARLASYLRRIPFVFHPYFYYPSREAKKWQLYRKTLGRLTMHADCVIAITEYEKKWIERFFRPRRIEIVPPGLNSTIRRKIPYNIFHKRGLQGKRIILFAGRICYGKGVDVLIKAFSRIVPKHPDTILAISGQDFGDQAAFVKLAAKLNVTERIVWLGEIPYPDLVSAYQNATIFCCPTLYENFGIVLAEAMASGLPIVSTNFSAVPYVVPKDEAGFLTKRGDDQKTAYYLNKLLSNPDLAREMGERGRQESLKYDWERVVDRVEEIYYSLV